MIRAIAPCRISFFGGGTDLPIYSDTYGGRVLSMAINIRQEFLYSDTGVIHILGKHKFHEAFLGEKGYGLAQNFSGHLEAGLGTSAAAAVALLGIKHRHQSREWIAERAWEIEVNKLGLYGGKQDQYASAFGGCNLITFNKHVTVTPIHRGLSEDLAKRTLLFYSGNNRKSTKIQDQLKELSNKQKAALNDIKNLVDKANLLLHAGQWESLGYLLGSSWKYKKDSNPLITTKHIDKLYAKAMKKGAWGGKLCGSGGGGYMIFIAPRLRHKFIIKALEGIGAKHIDFSIDWNGLEVTEI